MLKQMYHYLPYNNNIKKNLSIEFFIIHYYKKVIFLI